MVRGADRRVVDQHDGSCRNIDFMPEMLAIRRSSTACPSNNGCCRLVAKTGQFKFESAFDVKQSATRRDDCGGALCASTEYDFGDV